MKFETQFVPDAGLPQYEPSCEFHIGERPFEQLDGNTGVCRGCKGVVELERGRIPDHEPALPQCFVCPICETPYPYPSYTDPPCDDCAYRIDVLYALRSGMPIEEIIAFFGPAAAQIIADAGNGAYGAEYVDDNYYGPDDGEYVAGGVDEDSV